MKSLAELAGNNEFIRRHTGPSGEDQQAMLQALGYTDMAAFIAAVIPDRIRSSKPLALADACTEQEALAELRAIAGENQVFRSFIGQGYYGCFTPNVILRNVLENPAWYTAYTPYQPEISQGRLEAMLNFQTLITDLTGMDLASASLLDEGTAAAEAMTLCRRMAKSKSRVFFVDRQCLPQTIEVVCTRAEPMDIEVVIGDPQEIASQECFGVLLQYPGADGSVEDFSGVIETAHQNRALVVMAADILSLMLLQSPARLDADVAIGSTQRFGVPLGFGGPHAAYMATRDAFKRSLPGRLVGVSVDSRGKPAFRLALQTREQHIRREKATSNICTAQVLLAVMASMYAVYHGPEGLRRIAERVHCLTSILAAGLTRLGFTISNHSFFDTLTIASGSQTAEIYRKALAEGINLRVIDQQHLGISLDETTTATDVETLWQLFDANSELTVADLEVTAGSGLPQGLLRTEPVLTHPVFNRYHSETEMLRYLRKLADKDIALDRAMIPLGSCTMKLNATAEMIPVSWPEFAGIHPFAPADQTVGYRKMIGEVEAMLCAATGYDAVSLQPNAGSQGEYAGLLAIRAYHRSRGDSHRNICLIPSSAHGTNPASAQMCGMQVVVVGCDERGNVDLAELRDKAAQYSDQLAAIMVTYPSTHGVFEEGITDICEIVHEHGGQVYIDGANLNAMVGLCQPGQFGGDVSHLNLHKTFCIPHGGGGPGVGPVAVKQHLAEFLPGHGCFKHDSGVGAVSSAPWGSASILPITWMYIKMMGAGGLKQATEVAILNANYVAGRLKDGYPILYTGSNDRVAHECIIDLTAIRETSGMTVDDVAKRLIDYGFHAPTMSFPVAGTMMIEPTESESREELDRLCDALLQIREEIAAVERGEFPVDDNPLCGAPHTADELVADQWVKSYSREQAAYPLASLRESKYWSPVGRIDNVYGDRNLICACLPVSEYI
ncbi:aminomethyl-transferring glycine dehydrogenase [Porticoccus sp.]|uniref:aminomethyl-transferring glycine dehydrogenase n=1 Tax=Porticoccus sp. TaxID=2024853 RepID=UPI003F697E72